MGYYKYVAIAKVEMLNSLAYATDFFLGSSVIAAVVFIFYFLWKAIYAQSASQVISGFTFVQLMWYLVMSESIFSRARGNIIKKINDDIKTGDIAYAINKPYGLLPYAYASSIGQLMLTAASAFVFSSVIIAAMVGLPSINLADVPFMLVSIVLAMTLLFLIYFASGMLAFWLEDTSAVRWIISKIIFIFGGVLIPLQFLPDWLKGAALVLPFSYTSYAPASLFVKFTFSAFASSVFMQISWIVIFVLLISVFEKIGLKRVVLNGG